ncbi:MAG: formyltransferase family protein [Candidatus Nanopelagicales bacterium]
MRLVFAGTPEVAVVSLEAVLASRHEVLAVVTRPDAVAGRGHRLTPSPVSQAAQERGIPVLTPVKPSDPEFIATLTELAPDCCPVVAYGALVPQRVLDIPRSWLGESALLAAAGVARGGTRAAGDHGRRRRHRCRGVPTRGGDGHRTGLRGCH